MDDPEGGRVQDMGRLDDEPPRRPMQVGEMRVKVPA